MRETPEAARAVSTPTSISAASSKPAAKVPQILAAMHRPRWPSLVRVERHANRRRGRRDPHRNARGRRRRRRSVRRHRSSDLRHQRRKIMTNTKPIKLAAVEDQKTSENAPQDSAAPDSSAELSIAKPSSFNLDKFKSRRTAMVANVETLLTALPHHTLKEAGDYCRLHPDEETYWSPE